MKANDISINIMNLSDLESIKDILFSDFDDFWNYNILKDELNSKNSIYIVAKKGKEILGFAGIKIILDECDLMNIVVRKDCRNQRVGTLLLNKLLKICKFKNINAIFLEVNTNNSNAIHLYEKIGFKPIYTRKEYYNNKDNAIIMKYVLE